MEKQLQEMAIEIKRLRDAMASARAEIDYEANMNGASEILKNALAIPSSQLAGIQA